LNTIFSNINFSALCETPVKNTPQPVDLIGKSQGMNFQMKFSVRENDGFKFKPNTFVVV